MSSASVVCPHCNARQPDRDPCEEDVSGYRGKAERPRPVASASTDKARALLALSAATETPRIPTTLGEMFDYALFPRTRGARRWLEIGLTIPSVPLLVVAIVAAKSYSARFRVELTFGGLLLAVPVAAVAGYAFCRGFGVDHLPALLAMLAMGGAWIAREVLRWSS